MCKTTAAGSRERASEKPARRCLIFLPSGHPLSLHPWTLPSIYLPPEDMEGRAQRSLAGIPVPPQGRQCCQQALTGTVPLLPALSSLVFGRVAETWSECRSARPPGLPQAPGGAESRRRVLDTPRLSSLSSVIWLMWCQQGLN